MLKERVGFRRVRLISRTERKRNYVNASSTSVSAVEKTVRTEKWRKKRNCTRKIRGGAPVFQTASFHIYHRRWTKKTTAVGATPVVNSRPIKRTNRQTSFREDEEETTASCRHRRAYRGSLAAKCQLSLLAAGN